MPRLGGISSDANVTREYSGTGSPEGAITAPQGSTYVQTDGASGSEIWDKATGSGNTGWRVRPASGSGSAASEAAAGIAEIATQAETDAGTDDARFVTPLKLANYSELGGGSSVFVQVARQAVQSISSATDTIISWDTEVVDVAANFFNSGAADRITIQANGNYIIRASGLFALNATGIRGISIKVNGTVVATALVSASLDGYGRAIVDYMAQLVSTDYIQLQVYQDSGSAKNFGGNVDVSLPRPTLTVAAF